MSLPGLNIQFSNGNIKTVVPTDDSVFGMLASAVAVTGKFDLETPYKLTGMQDVAKLGILPDTNNYVLYNSLLEFYTEAGEGAELWLMGFARNTKVSDWFTPDTTTGIVPASKLLDAANGKISLLLTKYSPADASTISITNGVDGDVWTATAKAQSFTDSYTAQNYAPVFALLEGYAYNGNAADLPDLTEDSKNRVAIFIGDTKAKTGTPENFNTANHILAARLSKLGVQENAGKVKRGALATTTAFIVDTPVEHYDVEALHDKGYITFRTHVRKAGYYITDDPLATSPTDDYSHITRRRVADKAFRIAHNVLSGSILDDFDVNNDGTINEIYAASIEADVESAIYTLMTLNGELSADKTNPNDLGVKAHIDRDTNVVTTGRVSMVLKIRPKGMLRWLDVALGYDINLQN